MFVLNPRDKTPIYEQITAQLKRQVALGLWPADAPLPSVRQLSVELSVNPNTIQKAYRMMEQAGLIYSVPGKGSFITGDTAAERSRQAADKLDSLRRSLSEARELGIPEETIAALVRGVYAGTDVKEEQENA